MMADVLQGIEDCCIERLTQKLHSMGKFTNKKYVEIKNYSKFVSIYRGFFDLKSQWEENGSDLQKSWLNYVDMIDILLKTHYAVWSRNWYLLLSYISAIIPLVFGYDNINYVGYLAAMFAGMSTRNYDYPEIYQEFVAEILLGSWAVLENSVLLVNSHLC